MCHKALQISQSSSFLLTNVQLKAWATSPRRKQQHSVNNARSSATTEIAPDEDGVS